MAQLLLRDRRSVRLAERRAHHDLECPSGEVTVTRLAGDTYIARGCGRKATSCVDNARSRAWESAWSCIKEN